MLRCLLSTAVLFALWSCHSGPAERFAPPSFPLSAAAPPRYKVSEFTSGSWQHFLQHLPTKEGEPVDYRGGPVYNPSKAFALITYDVGTRDLQQCADALMRLRAEYIFSKKRFDQIRFHLTSGDLYTFSDYCKGIRPLVKGASVRFSKVAPPTGTDHAAMRRYLDIVYTYAGTISLAKELKPATAITVGTVVIKPGSPGHCFIVVNEAVTETGEKVYQLAEGYTPAQSIYLLKNQKDGSPWHSLAKGRPIQTASYSFTTYQLGRFE